MRILGFGTYDADTHPRSGIILEGFRAHGDEVIELNEPLGLSTAERVTMLGKPWLAYRIALRLIGRWGRLVRRSWKVRGRRFDLIFVGYLGHFDVVLARVLFPSRRIALDLLIFAADTARDRGVTGGYRLRLLAALDRLAIVCSNLVLLDTEAEVELLPSRARDKAVVAPVGASPAWFTAGENRRPPSADGLRVVFFGLFTPLQGAPVIGGALALLSERPDIFVTMIGNGQDYAATRRLVGDLPNVNWTDWVDAADLPRIVAEHDVCLGIFGTSAKAARVVPNKVFQGAAAGCAIVTSDTAPQRDLLGAAALFVPPGDPAALAGILRTLADERTLLAELKSRARSVATERFSPPKVIGPLRSLLVQS